MYTVQHVQIVRVRLFQNDNVKLVTGWVFLRRLKVLAHNVNCLAVMVTAICIPFMTPCYFVGVFILNLRIIIDNLFPANV